MMRCAVFALGVIALTLAACSREHADWRTASGADTLEAYDRFVRAHPEGELAAEARARITQLTEVRDWQRAVASGSAQAYRDFLRQHPSGRQAEEARIRIDNLTLRGAAAQVPPTGAGYAIQLGAFSSDGHAREAWQRLLASHAGTLAGLTPLVVAADPLYRLQAAVADEARARELCAQLRQSGAACVVVLLR